MLTTDYYSAIDEALKEAEDGMFVSGDEVIEWMKSWGTETELPTPQPVPYSPPFSSGAPGR